MNRKTINILVTIAIMAIIALLIFIFSKFPMLFVVPATIAVAAMMFCMIYMLVDDVLWRHK